MKIEFCQNLTGAPVGEGTLNMEKLLHDEMIKAIEDANEKELQYLIAKDEKERLIAAYKAYCTKGGKKQ